MSTRVVVAGAGGFRRTDGHPPGYQRGGGLRQHPQLQFPNERGRCVFGCGLLHERRGLRRGGHGEGQRQCQLSDHGPGHQCGAALGRNRDQRVATSLTQKFNKVQANIRAGHSFRALADLHSFADHARAQSGKHIGAATTPTLLSDAQLVYASLGGTGSV